MMISTRGRYALRVLTDLAEHRGSGYIPMKDVPNIKTTANNKHTILLMFFFITFSFHKSRVSFCFRFYFIPFINKCQYVSEFFFTFCFKKICRRIQKDAAVKPICFRGYNH